MVLVQNDSNQRYLNFSVTRCGLRVLKLTFLVLVLTRNSQPVTRNNNFSSLRTVYYSSPLEPVLFHGLL